MTRFISLAARGAAAGFAATLPMSIVMLLLHRMLPRRERYPLPPRLITEELTEASGVAHEVDQEAIDRMTVANHFAYGAVAAIPYAVLAPRLPGPSMVLGAAYGAAVWAGSYLGWLPATGILRPATEAPPRRNALMIVSHLVYGAALAWLVAGMGGRRRESPRDRAMHVLEDAAARAGHAAGGIADDIAERLERMRA